MIPPVLLFSLGLLGTEGWGQIFPKWPPPEKVTLLNIPESFASNILPSQQTTFIPFFPGGPPRIAVRFDSVSYGAFALPWDPVHMKVCVCLSRMGSLFPPVLWSSCALSPTGLQCQMLWGVFLPVPDPQAWGPDVELRILTPVGEFL